MSESPRPTPEQLARYAEEFNQSQTMRLIGFKVSFPGGERVRVDLDPVQPEHRGGLGSEAVNGGVLSAMFDLAIGCTAALLDPLKRSATMQLSMSFERPTRGNRIVAEAWITNAGGKTIFATATVSDEKGRVCARCNGVVRRTDLPWERSSPAIN